MTKKNKKLNLNPNELLVLAWTDITSMEGWLSENEAKSFEPAQIKSCGWLLSASDKEIRITNTISKDGESNVLIVPVGCIQKIIRVMDDNGKVINKEIVV